MLTNTTTKMLTCQQCSTEFINANDFNIHKMETHRDINAIIEFLGLY